HDQQETAASFDGDLSFDSFVMSDRGLEHDSKFVCQPFKVLGRCRNPSGDGWSRLLWWQDADGREHRFTVSDAALHQDARTLCADLASRGLRIERAQRNALVDYLNGLEISQRVTLVERTGWHKLETGETFVLTDESIGDDGGEQIALDLPAAARITHYESRG